MNRYGDNNEYVLAYEANAVLDGWKLALGQEKADRKSEVSRLTERCAGLERERDALLAMVPGDDNGVRVTAYHDLMEERDALQATLDDYGEQIDLLNDDNGRACAKIAALQAKLAALTHAIKSHCKDCRTEVACGECFLVLVEGGGK